MDYAQYAKECTELDMVIALNTGWSEIRRDPEYPCGTPFGKHVSGFVRYITCYTHNDAEAFRLAVEYNCNIQTEECPNEHNGYSVHVTCGDYFVSFNKRDFPNKLAAVRFAIVQAVVNKLQGEK